MSRFIALAAVALALTACSTAAQTPPPRAPAPPAGPTAARGTPFSVASSNRIVARDERAAIAGWSANPASVSDNASTARPPPCKLQLKNVPDGIAVLFAPRGSESLESLRERVRSVAQDQNALGSKSDELTGTPLEPKLDIPVRAVERNTVSGAELVLTTSRAADVTTLRALVEWHEADMLPDMTESRTEPAMCPTTRWIQKPV